jgi:hypothetical protein
LRALCAKTLTFKPFWPKYVFANEESGPFASKFSGKAQAFEMLCLKRREAQPPQMD